MASRLYLNILVTHFPLNELFPRSFLKNLNAMIKLWFALIDYAMALHATHCLAKKQ